MYNTIRVLCDIAGCILNQMSLKVVCNGPIKNEAALIRIMFWRQTQIKYRNVR